mgnify:FL=1
MSIHIGFACGHTISVSDQVNSSPVCHCGTTQITSVRPTRAPRFTGTCSGPHAEYQALTPGVVNVAPAGPLTIKKGE